MQGRHAVGVQRLHLPATAPTFPSRHPGPAADEVRRGVLVLPAHAAHVQGRGAWTPRPLGLKKKGPAPGGDVVRQVRVLVQEPRCAWSRIR